jgi:hypothetical protein
VAKTFAKMTVGITALAVTTRFGTQSSRAYDDAPLVRSHKSRKRRVLELPIPHIRGLLSECDWWQPRLLQPEPLAWTVSGNPLQTPETPLAILTSARRGAADCGEYRKAAGVIRSKRLDSHLLLPAPAEQA